MDDKVNEMIENIKSSVMTWWTAVNADKRPKPNPARMVTVAELPMYPDETPFYKEVQEVPLPVKKEMALLRQAALRRLGVGESYLNVEEKSKKVLNSAQEFSRFLQEDYALLPKAAAITVGGLTGFFLGMKKFLYSGIGLLTMTAFCYPYETIAITRTAVEHGKIAWNDFVRCKIVFGSASHLMNLQPSQHHSFSAPEPPASNSEK